MSEKILTVLGILFLGIVILSLILTQSITYIVRDYTINNEISQKQEKIINNYKSTNSLTNSQVVNLNLNQKLNLSLGEENVNNKLKLSNDFKGTSNDDILEEEIINPVTKDSIEITYSKDDNSSGNNTTTGGDGDSEVNPPFIESNPSGSILEVEEFQKFGQEFVKIKYDMNIPPEYTGDIKLTLYDINGKSIRAKEVLETGIDEAIFPSVPGTIQLRADFDIIDMYDYKLTTPGPSGEITSVNYILGGVSAVDYKFSNGQDIIGKLNIKAINNNEEIIYDKNLIENDDVLITSNTGYNVYLYYGEMLLDSYYFDGGEAVNVSGNILEVTFDENGKLRVNYNLNASEREARTASIEFYSSNGTKIETIDSLASGKGSTEGINYSDDLLINLVYAGQILDSYEYEYISPVFPIIPIPNVSINRIDPLEGNSMNIYYTFEGTQEQADNSILNYHIGDVDEVILSGVEIGSHVVRYNYNYSDEATIQFKWENNTLAEKEINLSPIPVVSIFNITPQEFNTIDFSYSFDENESIAEEAMLVYRADGVDEIILSSLENGLHHVTYSAPFDYGTLQIIYDDVVLFEVEYDLSP